MLAIAADVKNAGLNGKDEPELYRLRRSFADDWNPWTVITLKNHAISGCTWLLGFAHKLHRSIRRFPSTSIPLAKTVNRLADRPRFETALLGFFALCGLLMAVIGLYGVIAYVAAQRTQEIGVRMALGATRLDILRLIAGEGVRLICVWAGSSVWARRLLRRKLLKSLLFHVGTHDPASFIAVTLLLALVALVATLIPARAAMKTDPMTALRTE